MVSSHASPAITYDQYDVAVVGHGISGLSTALTAYEKGANPVILEKSPKEKRGGHTQYAGGLFRFPMENPDDVERVLELDRSVERYTREDFFEDLMEVSDRQADETLASVLVENAYEAIQWLTDNGLSWHVVDHSEEPGFGTTVGSVQADGEGEAVIRKLTERAEERGIDIHYDTEFRGVVTDSTNVINGARAVGPGGHICYNIPSVVICAGSYVANTEKRTRYFGEDGDAYIVRGSRYNTGEALDGAMEAGAKPAGEWGGAHQVLNDINAPDVEGGRSRINGYQYGVILNKRGERFVDEGEDFLLKTYAKFGKRVHEQPDQQAFVVFDSSVDHLVVSQMDSAPVTAETLDRLINHLDINDNETALFTLNRFNEAAPDDPTFDPHTLDGVATEGLDLEKTNWAVSLTEPPYKCFPVVSAITFAFGGLKITSDAKVLDRREKPISGLWAVGNSTAGFFYENYPGGSALTRGATFGRIAGAQAARHAAKVGK